MARGSELGQARRRLTRVTRRPEREMRTRSTKRRIRKSPPFTFIDQGWNSVLLELKDYCERKERSVKRPSKTIAKSE